ncbi:hypothetical protein [Enterobacter sp. RIT418]|uniref:hypothetical protein n=1 Tax=Enterobacter sp. RIT418 TaxID=2202164 RepID=UPI0011BDCF4A|nr:hypothetical protein [Enterobacter sp. RIT 418]
MGDNASTGESDNASVGDKDVVIGSGDNASTSTTVSQSVNNYGVKTNSAGVPVDKTPSSTPSNTSVTTAGASHLDSNITYQEREAAKQKELLNQL